MFKWQVIRQIMLITNKTQE